MALMLLAAGGAAAWKLDWAELTKSAEEPPAGGESRFVEIPALMVPVVQDARPLENLALSVQLEVAGAEAEERAQERLPLLTDAMLTELYGVVALRYVLKRDDSMEIIRERLARAAREVLGEEALRNVLLTSFDRRPVNRRSSRDG